MSYSLVNSQPSKCAHMVQEKQPDYHSSSSCEGQCAHHSACHKKRLRRVLMMTLTSMMTVAFLLCLSMSDFGSELGLSKRQSTGTSNGQQSIFVKNKLYLIVVFVGLFICLILAIMLTACCCRDSFENPLCCPCYLCACIGGLECLECISCGLCAEGLSQL